MTLALLNNNLLEAYNDAIAPIMLKEKFEALKDAEISTETFSFYTSVSAMASSKIEGEQLEIDSYVKHKMLNIEYLNDLTEKPNDLYNAYIFAQTNKFSEVNFLKAHSTISEHLLPKSKRGKYRQVNMLVMEHKTFRVQFEAVQFEEVKPLMTFFWRDVKMLIDTELSVEEVFYFASFLHMAFVCIHPFEDGNGRSARLLEKWFIAEKLGERAWFLQSELFYYNNVKEYYQNLNRLGIFYEKLDYGQSLSFLLMLPQCLKENQ